MPGLGNLLCLVKDAFLIVLEGFFREVGVLFRRENFAVFFSEC